MCKIDKNLLTIPRGRDILNLLAAGGCPFYFHAEHFLEKMAPASFFCVKIVV